MYNQFFRLRENPFNVNPDPRYLFLTCQTEEAWDGLKHGIQARKGLLLLTGEVGTGKTTLLNHLLDWLHQQRAPTAFIFNSHLEISHLFDFVLSDFAVKFDASLKDNALMRLHRWLWERYRAGDTPVVIVDEAQGLSNRVLEEIRMLLNLESCNEKLLQIVLAGQPELEARLQQPELRQVKQRIALRCKTAALSLEEARRYILARLHIAGADGPRIFASDAMDAVHFYSRGIPRVMNLLCEHALINASAAQIQPVPARFVAEVASEFQFDDRRPFAPSSSSADDSRGDAIPVQSRFLNALVSLSATDKPEPPAADCLGPSVVPAPRWHAAPENVFNPVQEPDGPVLRCENSMDDGADATPSSTPPFASPFAQAFAAPPAHPFASRSAHAIAPALENAFRTPSEDASAPRSEQSFAIPSETPDVQLAAPAAPWLRQLEGRLLADWTSFFSEIGSSLASDAPAAPIPEPVAATHPPRLHLVEGKTAHAAPPARRQAPGFQDSACASSRADGKQSLASISVLMKLVALRVTAGDCTAYVSAHLLSVGTAIARSRAIARLIQPCARILSALTAAIRSRIVADLAQLFARCRSSASSLYWGCLACADRCVNLAASIDWAQLWLTASTWLRQPCDPTQWRLPDVRPFNELLRFNHKKMS